jgi:hypothetical protein
MENVLMVEGRGTRWGGGKRRKFTYKSNYFYILTWQIEEVWTLFWERRATE